MVQSKIQYDLKFEDFLLRNLNQAEVIEGTVSLIEELLDDPHDRFRYAQTANERLTASTDLGHRAASLFPILGMFMDYTNNNKVNAEQMYNYYNAGLNGGVRVFIQPDIKKL